jgi:hypothetical protein
MIEVWMHLSISNRSGAIATPIERLAHGRCDRRTQQRRKFLLEITGEFLEHDLLHLQ